VAEVKRIVPCLDVYHGKVVKGVHFVGLRDAGDPVELAKRYCGEGADELVFLDITASVEERKTLIDVVRAVAAETTVPFTVGGGIGTVSDARAILESGADKVSVGTAAVNSPGLVRELAEAFGRQRVVVAVDAKRVYEKRGDRFVADTGEGPCWFEVYTHGGRRPTGLDAVQWSQRAAGLGAGELLVTSVDRDGTEDGYDLELTRAIAEGAGIPVTASGGAGKMEHFLQALTVGRADAALAASVFHYGKCPIPALKRFLRERGVPVRL